MNDFFPREFQESRKFNLNKLYWFFKGPVMYYDPFREKTTTNKQTNKQNTASNGQKKIQDRIVVAFFALSLSLSAAGRFAVLPLPVVCSLVHVSPLKVD